MSGRGDFEETEWKMSEKSCSAIRTEPRHLNHQESLTQATGLCAVENVLFGDGGDDVGKVLHDIHECIKCGNFNSVMGIRYYLEEGLGSVVIVGSIKCETAHHGVICMDKPEIRLKRLVYATITPLLNHNEPLHHLRLVLGTHICSDPLVQASQLSGLGQMWVDSQHFLHQSTSHNPFICCKEEQELRCEESDEHPRHLDEKATGVGVALGGYIEVQSAPYAYDQGAVAKRDDPKCTPLLWFFHPLIRGVAGTGSTSCRILHLVCGTVKQWI